MSEDHVGIVGTGLYIPKTVETAAEIAEKSGIPEQVIREKFGFFQKPVPGPEDGTMEMGAKAALDCLARTGTDPREIDVIVSIGEEHKEYPLVTSGTYIQDRIGAVNAWAFDIAQRCGTAVVAMKVAKSLMLTDPAIRTILIAGGYRNGDYIDYTNPRVTFMYNLGAGAGAILLKKNHGRNILLETAVISDGSFAYDVAVNFGGTKNPISQANVQLAAKSLDVLNPDHMKEGLAEKSMPNFIRVIDDSLRKSGYTRADIGYLAMLHMKRSAHLHVLQELGVDPAKSIYLEEYGHIGQIDQILSTTLALEQGKLQDGDLLVWVSAGIGYAWDACTIMWGEPKGAE